MITITHTQTRKSVADTQRWSKNSVAKARYAVGNEPAHYPVPATQDNANDYHMAYWFMTSGEWDSVS